MPVASSRRDRRRIVCREDGSMFDPAQRHAVSVEELRDHLIAGGYFEAETEQTGRDCTYEVLRRLMGGQVTSSVPTALSGLNPLAALGSVDAADLVRLFSARSSRDPDPEPPTRRRSRTRERAPWPPEEDSAGVEAGS